jgi:hypothetical protein
MKNNRNKIQEEIKIQKENQKKMKQVALDKKLKTNLKAFKEISLILQA